MNAPIRWFHFLEVCFMDIAGNRWRREREEFMHPRYMRACKVWFFKTFQGGSIPWYRRSDIRSRGRE